MLMLAGVLMQRIKNGIVQKKYENNANVILCDSLQSIEYWFLLHFEDTCRHSKIQQQQKEH